LITPTLAGNLREVTGAAMTTINSRFKFIILGPKQLRRDFGCCKRRRSAR
jgi:hypothetical protein